MKKKLIVSCPEGGADATLQDAGQLQRVLHEIAEAGIHEVVGILGKAAPAGFPHFATAEDLPEAVRDDCAFFVCDDSYFLNQRRLGAYMDIKRRGWPIVALVSRTASVAQGVRLRENVYIDHGVRVLPGANIGANAWIMSGSELGAGSRLGSSCWIGPRCRVSEGAVIGKNCLLGSGVVIARGVVLPDWSVINRPVTVTESPKTTTFLDPLFRAPVHLFDKPAGASAAATGSSFVRRSGDGPHGI